MKRKQRRRWSPEEKQRFVAEARARRDLGEGWRGISEALNVRPDSLHRWMRGADMAGQRATIQPVEVSGGVVSLVGSDQRSVLCVVAPDGFRFEGVDLEAAVRLWRVLR